VVEGIRVEVGNGVRVEDGDGVRVEEGEGVGLEDGDEVRVGFRVGEAVADGRGVNVTLAFASCVAHSAVAVALVNIFSAVSVIYTDTLEYHVGLGVRRKALAIYASRHSALLESSQKSHRYTSDGGFTASSASPSFSSISTGWSVLYEGFLDSSDR